PELPLGREVDAALDRLFAVMQAAAVRAVDAGDRPPAAEPAADQTAVAAALRAVAMHHVGRERADMAQEIARGAQVGRRDLAAHGKARSAEGEARGDCRDQVVLEGAALERVADDPDVVAGGRLRGREIEDVAEDAADRRAHQMDDAETGLCHTHNLMAAAPMKRRDTGEICVELCTVALKEALRRSCKLKALTRRKP